MANSKIGLEHTTIVTETIRELDRIMKVTPKQALKDIVKKTMGRSVRSKDPFFWPAGMLMLGLVETLETDIDESFHKEIYRAIDSHIRYWEERYGGRISYVDDALVGYSMVRLYQKTYDDRYLKIADEINRFLMEAPTDFAGSVLYNPGRNSRNIFADGIGQITLFMSSYVRLKMENNDKLYGNNSKTDIDYYNESNVINEIGKIYTQLMNYNSFGCDRRSYLPYHGYRLSKSESLLKKYPGNASVDARDRIDEIISEKQGILCWGRAFGWLIMGMTEAALLEKYLKSIQRSSRDWSSFHTIPGFLEISKMALEYQRPDGGWSWQLQAVDAHIDMSATGMIAYSIAKGFRNGLFEGEDIEKVSNALKRAYDCILAHSDDGKVGDALSSCDDFAVHYQTYGNYPWGQGACLAALDAII